VGNLGATDIDLTDHAMAVGACDVLTKPCSPGRLLGTVQKVLDENQSNERVGREKLNPTHLFTGEASEGISLRSL
jgi:DNA-binding NtrC family response regulator